MTHRPRPAAAAAAGLRATAAPILFAASALALAACGQHAYPGSSAPPPPPPPPAELMGDPDGPPPPPPPGPPQAYAPAQPGLDAPAQPTVQAPYGGQAGDYRPGYDGSQAYAPPQRSFPPGQCPPRSERLPTDGCMDPIANPPEHRPVHRHGFYAERGYETPRRMEGYAHHRRYVYGVAPHRHAPRRMHGGGLYRYVPYRSAHHAHHPMAAPSHHGRIAAVPARPTAHPIAHKPAAHAPAKPSGHGKGAKSASPSLKAPVTPDVKAGEAAGPAAALAAALTPVVKARAVLHADGLKTGQPGDVTLTLPPDFADGLRDQAKKAGMADAAASANLTAGLTGDGYTITPSDSQSQPLTAGQATTFKWTVTPQPNARGPLHAAVGADLLGGGVQHVDLGTVDAASSAPFKLSAQAVGWILLAVIGLVLLGLFAARNRRPPPPTGAVRPRNGVNVGPPLSMDETRR